MTATPHPYQQRYPAADEQGRRRLAAVLLAATVPLWQLNQSSREREDPPLLRPVWRRYFDQQEHRGR